MKTLEVTITSKSLSKSYKIRLDDNFAEYFKEELAIIVDRNNFLDAKDLLNAYVKKSYESFMQAKELEKLIAQIKELEKL
ncbi:hypothetical protein [uncultured Campylobacter sp.]|uniref:hypothetical protein n=1 Tax=uncultured Campylobacter sp. TaxID=218934 RepID=UPI0026264D0F|nr:hypothetical protein [uncultured Campylobacter sp.]